MNKILYRTSQILSRIGYTIFLALIHLFLLSFVAVAVYSLIAFPLIISIPLALLLIFTATAIAIMGLPAAYKAW